FLFLAGLGGFGHGLLHFHLILNNLDYLGSRRWWWWWWRLDLFGHRHFLIQLVLHIQGDVVIGGLIKFFPLQGPIAHGQGGGQTDHKIDGALFAYIRMWTFLLFHFTEFCVC